MNCLDCLDRTNTVQCFIALEVSSLGHLCHVLSQVRLSWVDFAAIGQMTGMFKGNI